MMRNISLPLALVLLMTVSCATNGTADISSSVGEKVVKLCADDVSRLLGEDSLSEADRAYVYVFKNGYDVSFTRGAVGTFGTRSYEYKQVLACGVSGDKVVFLGAPLKDAIIDNLVDHPYENYDDEVVELLFRKVDGNFKYCCSQKFDEKNIEKNNPDFPWDKGKVS